MKINILKFLVSFLLVFLLSNNKSPAQVKQLDSLKTLLVKYNDGDEKELKLLNVIALVQVNIKPNDALANADKAIGLAQKLNNQKELAVAYNNKGFVLLRKSQYEEANKFLKEAFALNTSIKNQKGIADNQTNLGEILRRQGETDSAKVFFEKALLIYQNEKNKNGIADAFYYLGLVFRDLTDNKNWLLFNDKAIELYRQTENENGLAITINSKGVYFFQTSDFAKAAELLREAIKIDERIGNLYGLALDYGNISNVYGELAEYWVSIDYTLKALRIYERMENHHMLANTYINVGIFYYEINQFEKALDFTLNGITIFEDLKINIDMYRNGLNNCGILYSNLNNKNKAFEYLNKSLTLNLAAKDDWGLSICYAHFGAAYLQINKYDSAIVSFKRGLALDESNENPTGIALNYLGLGKSIERATDKELFQAGINPGNRNKLIVDYLQKAITIGNKTQSKKTSRDSYEELSKFYESQENLKISFEYYRKFIAYKDSIMNKENANAISTLQLQYDTEKKEQEIGLLIKESQLQQTELQKQNTTRNVFIAALTLIALLALIIYNRYRIKQKANAAIESTMHHLKTTHEQLVEREKLAVLGKLTSDVARQIEVPVSHINKLIKANRTLIHAIRGNKIYEGASLNELKDNLHQIYNYGKDADGIVKNVLTETRKLQ